MKRISELSSNPSVLSAYNLMASASETTPSEARRTVEALDCVLQDGNPLFIQKIKEESKLWEDLANRS